MHVSLFHSIKLAATIAFVALAFVIARLYWRKVLRSHWHTRNVPHLKWLTRGPRSKYTTQHDVLLRDLQVGLPEHSGTVIRHNSWLLPAMLITTDRAALHEILFAQHMDFPKPAPGGQASIRNAIGQGLLFAEGEQWHRQRKIMSASFGPPQIKEMYSIFLDKAIQIRDLVLHSIADSDSASPTIDMHDLAERVALDTISSAGFGYETDSIGGDTKNPLIGALTGAFQGPERSTIKTLLRHIMPIDRLLPDNSLAAVRIRTGLAVMHEIGQELVKQKKEAALSALDGNGDHKTVNADQVAGHDLLSTLVRSNMSKDIPQQQRMSDHEVQAQISTFFVAGRATTSTAMSWATYALCTKPELQRLLRDEVCAVPTDTPTFDELNALPFLDAVVRETLRLYAPVAGTPRVAAKDTVLPLSEPYVDVNGVKRDSIFLPKGTAVYIPIRSLNVSRKIWGPDAEEFNPSRWLKDTATSGLPDGALEMPSLTMPTFLCGPRACIGFRFTLIEMKAVLFSLFRNVQFELAVPMDDIETESRALTRPRLKSRPQEGFQMPVKITALP